MSQQLSRRVVLAFAGCIQWKTRKKGLEAIEPQMELYVNVTANNITSGRYEQSERTMVVVNGTWEMETQWGPKFHFVGKKSIQ